MKILSVIFLVGFFSGLVSEARQFNFGSADVQNDCANVKLQVASRLDLYSKGAGLPEGTFTYLVAQAQRHKTGRKGSYATCIAKIETANIAYIIDEREDEEHYGADRNSSCFSDSKKALDDFSVIGTRMNVNQGWIFNPFCETFELFIRYTQ